jgi:predicted enzyme related to lactoylglutathione lyase
MAITKLRLAYHVHDDVAGLGAFYEQALGFQRRFQDAERWLEMQVGDARFAIASRGEAPEGCRGPVLVFESDDLEAAAQAIRHHGGEVVSRRDMGAHGRTLTARDPSGTVFQLFCRQPTSNPQ